MNEQNGKKNKNKLFIIAGIVLAIILVGVIVILTKDGGSSSLTPSVNNTTIKESESYKMDLRIYGKYNNKGINNIIMVTNYKDTDKDITITAGEKEEKYLVKEGKRYSVKDEKLTEVAKAPYENTEIFLSGASKLTNVEQAADEEISGVKYKVYKGTISSSNMNEIIEATELDLKADKDASVEVWLTQDNYVYKIYYKIDELTIYPSFFGYGKMNKVNLDMYKA